MSLLGNLFTKGKFTDSPNESAGWFWLTAIVITGIYPPLGIALITLTLTVVFLAFVACKTAQGLGYASRALAERSKARAIEKRMKAEAKRLRKLSPPPAPQTRAELIAAAHSRHRRRKVEINQETTDEDVKEALHYENEMALQRELERLRV